jgi:hypothetical protein
MSDTKWLKKDIDVESFYNSIQELIGTRPTLDKEFMNIFFSKIQEKVEEYVGQQKQDKCDPYNPTIYVKSHFEPFFWILGLMCLSWLTVDLKKKIIFGDCHNPNHNLVAGHPYCKLGSQFHKGFYDSVFNTIKRLEDFAYEETPNPIEGKATTNLKNLSSDPTSKGQWSHLAIDRDGSPS